MNSITKTGFKTISNFRNTSRCNCLGSATAFAALALMATAAFGGVVNHPDFSTDQVAFTGINESGADIPPGLFMPPDPTVTLSGSSNELSFFPNRFVITDQSLNFDLKSLSSQLGMFVNGKIVSGTAGPIGYELETLRLNIKGAYDLFAPFTNIPPSGATSLAQVQMSNVPLTIKVTGINWGPYAGGIPLGATINVAPNTVTVVGPNGADSGIWSGSYAVDMNALRAAAGILPTDSITQIQIQATATVYAASLFASAKASVTNFDIQTETAPVPVPEPPTIILAGLGAAAAVGHGYRRRKLRQRDEEGSNGEWTAEEGAIALTA
ncbi:MAG: PEP-CTERM sorting domain-containing protein [Planctomycetia bacterium]